jgi:hypothetical protein
MGLGFRLHQLLDEAFSGFLGGWVGFQKLVGVGKFQDTVNHSSGTGEAESATCGFHAGKTVDEFSEAAAVELGEFRKVEYNASLPFADQLIESQFELLALDAHLEGAA